MKKLSAIVVLSGGQDSATCLLWALNRYQSVSAISFYYGQKHEHELQMAAELCSELSVPHKLVSLEGLLSGSALIDHDEDINAKSKFDPKLPASFVPGRNALFLTAASTYAASQGVFDLITGVCQTDYSGYPDCRRVFIDSMQLTMSLALDRDLRIYTPLMYLDKAETWGMAEIEGAEQGKDGVALIRDFTLTDYNGDMTPNDWGFGKEDNPASVLRAQGYRDAIERGLIKG
jgi:7-cyano-7-deazaguanine synthase